MSGGRPKKTKHLIFKKEIEQLDNEAENLTLERPGPSKPTRAAKVRAIKKTSEIIEVLNEFKTQEKAKNIGKINKKRNATESQEDRSRRLSLKNQRVSHQHDNESDEKRSLRSEGNRQRKARWQQNESNEKRLLRLKNIRQRIYHRRGNETYKESSQRLRNIRQRFSQRRANETNEERSQRLENLRQHISQRRSNETNKERSQRLVSLRRRVFQRQANETNQERLHRLGDLRLRISQRRENESNVERSLRLKNLRTRVSQRQANETNEERLQRLGDLRQRISQRRENESNEERSLRLKNLRTRVSLRQANETNEERLQRLGDLRQRISQRRENETTEERSQRLENLRQNASERLAREDSERREQRLEEQRRRNVRRLRALEQNNLQTYKTAVDSNVGYRRLGSFNIECIHCEAVHFPEERVSNKINRNSFGDCCLHGRIELDQPKFLNELVRLFLHRHPLAEEFHSRIRNINSSFALASFNVKDDRTISSRGIYSFIACGQIYHKMNMAAHPTQNTQEEFERPQYGQIYFMDSENAITERLDHPLNHGISRHLMELLEEIIRSENPFAQAYMMMREVEDEVNERAAAEGVSPPHVKLLFTMQEGTDSRRFNVPTSNEVCAVLTLQADQSFPENEMVIHQRGKNICTLKNIDERVEPFTYPLFYPNGTLGFSLNVMLKTPYTSRQKVTRLEFAQYRMAFRSKFAKYLPIETSTTNRDFRQVNFNALHFGGRLCQQYLVDTYIRVERDRIQWIKSNQKKILADQYAGVNRFMSELAAEKNATVGEKIILPSSFTGSTRYYEESFEDAMAIVYRLGSPDFFIIVTSNPEWPEMKEASRIAFEDGTTLQQLAQDRPDLIARISKLKFDSIITDLDKNQIFGKVAAYVYTIEFQKRGLPHMHLLLIMAPDDKIHNPEELDDFISAEIPNNDDPQLRHLVLKWMIHNPCGDLNPNAPCMVNKNGHMKCRFDFPKNFQDVTSLVDDEKPKYRRRYEPTLDKNNPKFSHEDAVYRKDVTNRRITRDNRHVAPFNAYLLKKYTSHINVEYVGSIRAVKYLYKYIYKGHDCASIKIIEDQRRLIYNEPDTYVEGRCITPPEACWRLFGNEIQKKSHFVQRLDIHLPGQYRMSNIEQAQEDLADIGQKGSTLDAYFRHNQALRDNEYTHPAVYYHYWEMPEHFRWVGQTSRWVERKRYTKVIGRIHNVNFIAQPELYHLRVLLFHVNDATSFEDLLKVNGTQFSTYKQACLARGLAFDDQQWIEGLRESALSKSPRVMRILFAQILIFGVPENPKRLWDMFKADLAEDFVREERRRGGSIEDAYKRAYRIIAHKLNTEATEGRNFQHWVQLFGMDDIEDLENPLEEIANFEETAAVGESMFQLLKGAQINIVNDIVHAANDERSVPKCFFIDGPGGTGKTYIYKTIFHILSGKNIKVQCMAFTGIASILLPYGQTSHKTFGLKVPLSSDSVSNIKPGSKKAQKLAEVDVFLMDEAPMLPKYGLQNMDQILRAIANPNLPFGGKVMVLGGDFRQCLPVQPRANRSELLDLSIKQSELWQHFVCFRLTENMRVDIEQKQFADYLLKLGNGELDTNTMEEIELPDGIISNGNLIDEVFGNCLESNDYEGMKELAILAPLNKDVNKINAEIIDKLPGDPKLYLSCDTVKNQPQGELQFTTEFLNTIDIADLTPHKLQLKKNTTVMMLRNLDISEGLCNGTRLIVTELCNNIVKAKIITGEKSGREVHIPRITLDSNKCQLGCVLQRHQFPLKPAFAITIHKAQGQTFDFVGVDLHVPVFMHGMLYVAFSRVKRENSLKVRLPKETPRHTRNVVWKEVLNTIQETGNEEPADDFPDNLEDFFLDDF